MKNLFVIFLKVFLSLLAVFALHRWLAFKPLSESEGVLSIARRLDILAVGFLGDIWASALGSLALCLLLLMTRNMKLRNFLAVGFVLIISVLVGLHQAYAEYFKIQIIPQHLTYFGDVEFISSNGVVFFNGQSLLIVVLGVGLFLILNRAKFIGQLGIKTLAALSVAVLGGGLLAHTSNIYFRVQHFVPENLQTNMFERLYLNSKVAANPPLLSAIDLEHLEAFRGFKKPLAPMDTVNYEEINLWPVADHEFSKTAIDLKDAVQRLLRQRQKVVLLTILWESGRPSEMGIFQNDSTKGVTPLFDEIARKGIFFADAHATGTVTRGAQEAIWCGHLSSQMTSFMRNRRELKRDCLPRMLKNNPPQDIASSKSFWFHGGVGEYDSQETFWRSQGTDMTFSQQDYPADAAKTGWGVGDLALFEKSYESLHKLLESDPAQLYLGTILTVTNHTPWNLPSDAPDGMLASISSKLHSSYATTRYTDLAIGNFIKKLRASKFWDQMLIIIASDHGNAVAPLNNLYERKNFQKENLFSHVAMAMTGGIVDDVLKAEKLTSLRIEDAVSQADVAPWFAYLLGMNDQKFLGEPLLVRRRISPVVSDLGYGVYFPQNDFFVPRKDLLESDMKSNSAREKSDILYYRSFLHLLNKWGIERS
jgi:phosphoglycerol transferase MdoB-like AlkP superfamily enzyme